MRERVLKDMWIKVTIVLVLALLLIPITACAQSASDIANEHKILLDTDIEVIDTVSYAGATYHVVKYDNTLPYARGIEIISADSSLISDSEIAKAVLTQIAWKDAAAQLNASDIDTLKEILDTAKKINNTVPSVMSAINITRDNINELRRTKYTRDLIVNTYPEILTLWSDLRLLNSDLNEWRNSSTEMIAILPEVINGLEDLRAGKEMNLRLANNTQETTSSFEMLKTKTDNISKNLSDTISGLSDAESSMESAATRTQRFRESVFTLADCIGDLNNKTKSLREDAQLFSSSLSEGSLKLPEVITEANKKANELYGLWNSRRGASALTYLTVGETIAIAITPAIYVGVLIYRRRRKEGEDDVEKEEGRE
jgi:uncharacterized phage infection (PIP) family protein YhgE